VGGGGGGGGGGAIGCHGFCFLGVGGFLFLKKSKGGVLPVGGLYFFLGVGGVVRLLVLAVFLWFKLFLVGSLLGVLGVVAAGVGWGGVLWEVCFCFFLGLLLFVIKQKLTGAFYRTGGCSGFFYGAP
ncbi:hypothetical protein PUR25_01650, partial [Streptomyces sp. JV181]|uniref:hypothetical protein n=1 Tax=Streptomyces sp. JV181 TaxID=858635 RepID=UPI002E77C38C